MPRVRVVAGLYRVAVPDDAYRQLGDEVGPGTIIQVTEAELVAFPDKLERLPDEDQMEFDFEDSIINVEFHSGSLPPETHTEGAADITPAAASLAAKYGISSDELTGSGTGGRIVKSDVEAFIEANFVEEEDEE